MMKQRRWPRVAVLAGTLAAMAALTFAGLDAMGIGPNLGLPVGYYGRLNRVLSRIHASPDLEVVQTTLHRDLELEDFYITVRKHDGPEVRLSFEEAHTRPFGDLLLELKKVGL